MVTSSSSCVVRVGLVGLRSGSIDFHLLVEIWKWEMGNGYGERYAGPSELVSELAVNSIGREIGVPEKKTKDLNETRDAVKSAVPRCAIELRVGATHRFCPSA